MASQMMQGVDLGADHQPKLYGAVITVYVLAITAVVLRFYSRKVAKAGYWWDDWLIALALLFETGLFVDVVMLIKYGLGRHYQLYLDVFPAFMKSYIGGDVLYTTTNTVAKFSILAFYWRLFSDASNIRYPIYALASLTVAWFISTVLVSIFECTPVAFTWDRTIAGGSCINLAHFYLAVLLINFITDLAIVALPIRYLVRLQQNLVQKTLVCGIFILAGFVCIISIIRLVILVQTNFSSPDLTWNSADFLMWCVVETNIGIVGACLPSLGPILVQLTSRKRTRDVTQGSFEPQSLGSSMYDASRRHSTLNPSRNESNADSGFSTGKDAYAVQLDALDNDLLTPTRRNGIES